MEGVEFRSGTFKGELTPREWALAQRALGAVGVELAFGGQAATPASERTATPEVATDSFITFHDALVFARGSNGAFSDELAGLAWNMPARAYHVHAQRVERGGHSVAPPMLAFVGVEGRAPEQLRAGVKLSSHSLMEALTHIDTELARPGNQTIEATAQTIHRYLGRGSGERVLGFWRAFAADWRQKQNSGQKHDPEYFI